MRAYPLDAAGGEYHTCGIKSDGTLACWGTSTYGQLAAPSGTYTAISASNYQTCARKTDGTLACWGSYYNYSTYPAVSTAPPPSGTFTAVAAGMGHSCGVKTDGSLACWGPSNLLGQATPPAGTGFSSISAGAEYTCATTTAGALTCWGRNDDGNASPPNVGIVGIFASGGGPRDLARVRRHAGWMERPQ